MLLAQRLQSVAKMLGNHRRIADIGSDHAHLPVWLVKKGRIDFAVAGEILPGPLQATCRTICAQGLENIIFGRLGNGLEVLAPGEVDAVVLAGMGGAEIRRILDRSPAVFIRLQRIVCQPMTGGYGLRKWLFERGWCLKAQDLVLEDGRLYEMFSVVPGQAEAEDELLIEIGPLLWRDRHPLLTRQIKKLISQYQKRVDEMKNSSSLEVCRQREDWQRRIAALEAKRACL